MYKFRIVEIKKPGSRPIYIPEYKPLLFWYKIYNSTFYDTLHCNIILENFGGTYLYVNSVKIIDEFKTWLTDHRGYKTIHEIK